MFYRQGNGEVVALEDRCAHRFAPLEHGAHRRRQSHPVPLSRAGIRQDRRLRAPTAWQQEHSVAGAREELSGDGEAQGDLGLDGRQAGRPFQDSGLQRHGQRAGAARDQARQDHGQGQCRADHRQPARPQPHLVPARRHSRQRRHGRIRHRRRAGGRRHRRVALRPQRRAAGHEQADVAGRAGEGRQVHPHPLDGAVDLAAGHRRVPARRDAGTGQRAITPSIS